MVQRYLKLFRFIDFLSGFGSLAYGTWLVYHKGLNSSVWPSVWLIGGSLGLILAYLNLAERFLRIVNSKLSAVPGALHEDPGFPSPPAEPYSPPQ